MGTTISVNETTQQVQKLTEDNRQLLKEIISIVRTDKNKTSLSAHNVYSTSVIINNEKFKNLLGDCLQHGIVPYAHNSGVKISWINKLGRMDTITIMVQQHKILETKYKINYRQGKITIQ